LSASGRLQLAVVATLNGRYAATEFEPASVGDEGQPPILDNARGVVLVVGDCPSLRPSLLTQALARRLCATGIATLSMDMPTSNDADRRGGVRREWDLHELVRRLTRATSWLLDDPRTDHLPIGYFGTNIGAAAALTMAAERPAEVGAIVSSAGRPLLAAPALPRVRTPTLLIVAGGNSALVKLNRAAYAQLLCEKQLEILTGDPYLRGDPSTIDRAADIAGDWFSNHLEWRDDD
jgi:putative phosphoribosyl transferase